jgi:hypothetical protein
MKIKRPSFDGLWFGKMTGGSGLHDIPAGRAILDEALASLGFCGAILGSGHTAASGFLGHGMDSMDLLMRDCGDIMPHRRWWVYTD